MEGTGGKFCRPLSFARSHGTTDIVVLMFMSRGVCTLGQNMGGGMKNALTLIRCGKKESLSIVAREQIPCDTHELATFPKQVQAVVGLYDKLLQDILYLRARYMDKRTDGMEELYRECMHILRTLDVGLDLTGELAVNLHTLYGHCMRRLTVDEGYTKIEALDSVEMVISRIRHVYIEVAQREAEKEKHSSEADVRTNSEECRETE